MKPIFADTAFWIAIFDAGDTYHDAALRARARLKGRRLLTTDAVLAEFLNFVCDSPGWVRERAALLVKRVWTDAGVDAVPAAHESFAAAVDFYQRRLDKSYSHTDCLSMLVMRERGVREVLTTDEHFTQEGFTNLLPE